MSWYVSVALPDDPAPCHDAADTLRSVARAAREAADLLDDQAALPREDFAGLAAQSYRDASTTLGNDARGVADDTHALATALDDYAARIAAVRRTLTGIRADALAQGFTITPAERIESVPVPGTDLGLPFERLEARAASAHAEAEAARQDWWRAVQGHTTGPLAAPTSGPAFYPPVGPPVEPPFGPPVDLPFEPPGAEVPSGAGGQDAREEQPPADTSAPVVLTDPASSYGPEAASPHQPTHADPGPAGTTWHHAAIPLPPAPPVLHGEPLHEEPTTPCPSTDEGVLT